MRFPLALLLGLIGILVLLGGMAMFLHGLRTANFSPHPPGNDNFIYCVLAIPIMLTGFSLFVVAVFSVTFRVRDSDARYVEPSTVDQLSHSVDGISRSGTTVQCLNCGNSVQTSLSELEQGTHCGSCHAVITMDDIDWG